MAAAHEVGGLGPRVERSRAKFGFKGGKVSYEKAVEDGDGATGDSTTAPIAVLQAVRRCRFDDLDVTPPPASAPQGTAVVASRRAAMVDWQSPGQ